MIWHWQGMLWQLSITALWKRMRMTALTAAIATADARSL
jgi:hypothetical protein